eukprot:TRINITY_DN12536_c0_g1_i1.p1 TRINITY_DN12536_c0_g1~~TRINITY_DN12536_c0_g1_i1.p1  ORF type:complete len:450 (-),score=166.27 TRINITY_DN12536_c0_g1_i1:234-1583(-)
MAKKKIRECAGKKLLKKHIQRLLSTLNFNKLLPIEVTESTDWKKIRQEHPELLDMQLVAKPDMMFGKRGKHDLVLVNANFSEVKTFVKERIGKKITINESVTGKITHFLIEPFIEHSVEYYFSMTSERLETIIHFSVNGGVDIEENWDSVKTVSIPVGGTFDELSKEEKDQLLEGVEDKYRVPTELYINGLFALFEDLDFISIETNPFTFITDNNGTLLPLPLDLCAELDDTAKFKNMKKWGDIDFPDVFGKITIPEEQFIENMDAKTGASLKLSILNENGCVWNLVAGGGASVIFADTVVDLGYGSLLGNYGEYSGAPNAEQMYDYTKTVLKIATAPKTGISEKASVLLIGGGIANFTDVAKTFKGIIHALKEYEQKLKDRNMRIYVRRAGPNYQQGLQYMKDLGKKLNIPIDVYGPERTMTEIIPLAINFLKENGIEPSNVENNNNN